MWHELTRIFPDLGWEFVLIYARAQAFFLILPGIGERVVPGRVKVALAMSVTPLLAAGVAPVSYPDSQIIIGTQLIGEMLIGFAAGMMLRMMAMAIDIATAAIAATASLSQIIGVPNEFAPQPIGNFLHLAGIAILMAMGLPAMLIDLIADSLQIWPPSGFPRAASFVPDAIGIIGHSFALAMLLAAPFTLGGLLFQALSGVVNRAMPNLPVVFIAAPLAILLALTALVLISPTIIGVWADAVLSFRFPD